jgi:hypothetical protein
MMKQVQAHQAQNPAGGLYQQAGGDAMKNLDLEVFKLEEVGLYYFKLGAVNFLFNEFYKKEILPLVKVVDDEDAYVFFFKETQVKKLSECTYYLRAVPYLDTVIVKRKKKLSLDCWFNVVKTTEEHIAFDDIFPNTEEGLTIFVFRNDKQVVVKKTRKDNTTKLIS